MKLAWLKRKIQVHYLCGALLALSMYLFLALVSSAQLDHTTIAFTSDRDSDWMAAERNLMSEIYLMDSNGDQIRRLTEAPGYDEGPAWSPDGQKITFVSHRDQVLQILNDKFFRREIYVTNVDGTNPINLANPPVDPINLTNHPAEDSNPAWSPDGTRIAFQSNRDGNFDIYVMAADGANPINLTNHPAEDSDPAWGPAPILNVFPKKKLTVTWGKLKTPH